MANQSFALDIKTFCPKQRCSPKKKVNTRFAAATCVGRGTIHHHTRVNIDNSTKAKNRDILLTATGHPLKIGTVPAKTGRMVSLCRPAFFFADPPSTFEIF